MTWHDWNLERAPLRHLQPSLWSGNVRCWLSDREISPAPTDWVWWLLCSATCAAACIGRTVAVGLSNMLHCKQWLVRHIQLLSLLFWQGRKGCLKNVWCPKRNKDTLTKKHGCWSVCLCYHPSGGTGFVAFTCLISCWLHLSRLWGGDGGEEECQ